MSTTALAKARIDASEIRKRATATVRKIREKTEGVEHRALVALSGAAIAELETRQILPIAVGPVPMKAAIAIVGHMVAANSSGQMREGANLVADAAAAIYGYEAAKTKKFIAG